MLKQLPSCSRLNGASTSWRSIAAVAKESASGFATADVDHAIEGNTGETAHSRFAGQET
jgi:hypothetical protein